MQDLPRRAALGLILASVAASVTACGRRANRQDAALSNAGLFPGESPAMRRLVNKYATFTISRCHCCTGSSSAKATTAPTPAMARIMA